MAQLPHADAPRPTATTKDGKNKDGETRAQLEGESLPKLPHERDESSGSQPDQNSANADVGKRAHDDATGDAVDTDRAPVTDRVYNDMVKR